MYVATMYNTQDVCSDEDYRMCWIFWKQEQIKELANCLTVGRKEIFVEY